MSYVSRDSVTSHAKGNIFSPKVEQLTHTHNFWISTEVVSYGNGEGWLEQPLTETRTHAQLAVLLILRLCISPLSASSLSLLTLPRSTKSERAPVCLLKINPFFNFISSTERAVQRVLLPEVKGGITPAVHHCVVLPSRCNWIACTLSGD